MPRVDLFTNACTGRCSRAFTSAVLVLGLTLSSVTAQVSSQVPAPKFYRERNPVAVEAFVRAHRSEVFVYGSLGLLDSFDALLLEGLKSGHTRVRVIADASQAQQLSALQSAGAEVRLQRGAAVSRSGYTNAVALFERRFALFRTSDGWQLLESQEGVAQMQSRFEVLWAYSIPLKGR
jgi:hypothetical protein